MCIILHQFVTAHEINRTNQGAVYYIRGMQEITPTSSYTPNRGARAPLLLCCLLKLNVAEFALLSQDLCISVLAGCCCHAKPRKPCMTEVVAVEAVECAVPAQNQSADAPAAPAVPAPAQAK